MSGEQAIIKWGLETASGALPDREAVLCLAFSLVAMIEASGDTVAAKHPSLGMYYYGARGYSPSVGAFAAMDPAGVSLNNPHSVNRYVYANNNPIHYVDPNGESPLDVAFLIYDVGKFGVAVYRGWSWCRRAVDVGISVLGVMSPVLGTSQMLKAARTAGAGSGGGQCGRPWT